MLRVRAKSPWRSIFTLATSIRIVGGAALGCVCTPAVMANDVITLAPVPAGAPAAAEINAFLAADKKQMPPPDAVLFIGSSSIRLWDTLAKDFPEIPVINRGFGGSFIHESTLYADRIAIPYHPKIIILCAGTNDLAYGNESPQQVFLDYKAFVDKIHAALPGTRIVYLAINPTVARWKQESKNLEVKLSNRKIQRRD